MPRKNWYYSHLKEVKEYSRTYYASHKLERKKYRHEYYLKNRTKNVEYNRKWRDENRGKYIEAANRHARNNIEKAKARRMVNIRIQKGTIIRGPCEKCGTTINVHGHHPDYSKPLSVQWLCIPHHAEVHSVHAH